MKQTADQMLLTCGLTDAERELIRLFGLHGTADADEIHSWFASVDFERLSPECVCMATVMCGENGYKGVPEALLPRVKGVVRYHRVLNSALCAAMCDLIRSYNQLGIDVMVLKGGAIKLGYCPDFVRPMWDVDILVHEEDYPAALKFAEEQGFSALKTPHSADLHRGKMESIDLHCVFFRDIKRRKSRAYWPESREIIWRGTRLFIPEPNALMLQLIVNSHNNFTSTYGIHAPLRWVMDIDVMLRSTPEIDWDNIAALAKQLQVEAQMAVVLAAFDCVLPGMIDAASIICKLGKEKETAAMFRYMKKCRAANAAFRNPPPNCSTAKLVWIHTRWLWYACREENPGTWLHGLRCFPSWLCGELHIKSLFELPAVALRKIKKRRSGLSK